MDAVKIIMEVILMSRMKNSGVQWIGEIPDDWHIVRVKNIFKSKKEVVGDKADEYERLSLTLNGVLKRSKDANDGLQPEEFKGYQVLYENELVFKLIDLENIKTSRVGLSPFTGIVSPAYITLNNEQHTKYGYYFFLSMWQRNIFNALTGDGVRGNLSAKDLLNLKYPSVPLNNQEAIVCYLDQKVAYIDTIIEKTKESIEEYRKLKQSIITETVTKGLNPDVKMKDSGIEWIGEIPEHWECTKLKRLLEIPITDGPHETPNFTLSGIPFLSAESIKNNKLNFELKRGYISQEDFIKFSNKCKPRINDIFMVKSGATTGNIALVETNDEFSIWSPLALIRASGEILHYKFLFYYLQSYIFNEQVKQFWNYGTQQNLGMGVLSNLYLAYPPINEQNEIFRILDNKTNKIDLLLSMKLRCVEELESYKKSLIYEVVTGKKEIPTQEVGTLGL